MENNKKDKYNEFIEQKKFENDLKDIFENVAKASKEKESLQEAKKKSTPKKKTVVKKKSTQVKIEPKNYVSKEVIEKQKSAITIEAEKFIPNNMKQKDIGVDINALANSLKSDPNFMARIAPRPIVGQPGSGLGHKETIQLIRDNPGRVDRLGDIGNVNTTSATDGQYIFWDELDGEWRTKDITLSGGVNDKVAVDSVATPGYLGISSATGVLRTTEEISYTLSGDYVRLGLNQNSISASQITDDEGWGQPFDTVQFNTEFTSASNPAWSEGLMFYDYENKSVGIYNDQNDVTLQIGQELYIRIVNKTGSTILNGQAVTVSGAQGQRPKGVLSIATSADCGFPVAGLATHDIPDNQEGFITTDGVVGDLDTSDYPIGTILYLSTVSAGYYTSAEPEAPYGRQRIGVVIESHNINGRILLQLKHYNCLQDLRDVDGTTPQDGYILRYTSANSYWDASDDLNVIENDIATLSASTASQLTNNVINVSVSGDDGTATGTLSKPYRTVKSALDSITDNSSNNRYVVVVNPGKYTEDNPLIMKDHVNLVANGKPEATIINALNDDVLISACDESELWGFTLNGTSSLDVPTICMEVSGMFISQNNHIKDSDIGYHVNNVDAQMSVNNSLLIGTIGTGYLVDSGQLAINGIVVEKSTIITDIVITSGANSKVDVSNLNCISTNIIDCIHAYEYSTINVNNIIVDNVNNVITCENNSEVFCVGGIVSNCTSAFIVDTSATLGLYSIAINDSTDYDLIGGNDTTIRINGCRFREDLISIGGTCDIIGQYISDFPGDNGTEIKGELHVGTSQFPAESVFGQGDSYVQGMMVYGYNASTSAYTNLYSSASVAGDGNEFTFPTNEIDSAIYFASDLIRDGNYFGHLGVKLLMTVSAGFLSGTDVAFEYYNKLSSTWEPFNIFLTDSSSPYTPYGNNLQIPAGSYQLRYDNKELKGIRWGKNDPIGSGVDRFWIRWRIDSPFDSLPIFDQTKLHSNRAEINSDGWGEYFGRARPIAKLPWTIAGLQKASTNPGDGDLYYSDNLDIGFTENAFTGDGMRVGFTGVLPLDMDTSCPANFKIGFRPDATGVFNYTIRYTYAEPYSSVYDSDVSAPATHPNELSIVSSASAVENELCWLEEDLYFPFAVARRRGGFPDTIAMTIERESGSVNLDLVILVGEYTKWCDGGHIDPSID